MKSHMNKLLPLVFAALTAIALTAGSAMAGDKTHHLALQVSDNDHDKMTAVLNVAANVATHT